MDRGRRRVFYAALALVFGALAGSAQAAAPARTGVDAVGAQAGTGASPSTLPGGASSLQETFQDWFVACVQQGPGKSCSFAQIQTDNRSGQRVLSVELVPSGDTATGILILPFGLDLDSGVALFVGDEAVGPSLRFRTCLAVGCIVPLAFDGAATALLKSGAAMTVKARAENRQEVAFAVSLKGFTTALDRTAALLD
ncbi:invasion associated locus B family protein [Chthonobacter rhizosphaerae]|uniref:invasion associated locus B family protein n=1 Tax=Chthonobacter rhizosphaerae TaxID=2735553 RepID=UPI0015EF8DEA|nr:invasion associated locus B family protein [Chthonobacter rhizosphaerae]